MGKNSDGFRQRNVREAGKENVLKDAGDDTDNGDDHESWSEILVQVTPPYLCAGLGMVGAGLVLDAVQYWPVFLTLPELFIMVPALIGLKGNLEMTLASR